MLPERGNQVNFGPHLFEEVIERLGSTGSLCARVMSGEENLSGTGQAANRLCAARSVSLRTFSLEREPLRKTRASSCLCNRELMNNRRLIPHVGRNWDGHRLSVISTIISRSSAGETSPRVSSATELVR